MDDLKTNTESPENKDSRIKFKKGENHCKVDGKVVVKLSDGRTWCPSRQMRDK